MRDIFRVLPELQTPGPWLTGTRHPRRPFRLDLAAISQPSATGSLAKLPQENTLFILVKTPNCVAPIAPEPLLSAHNSARQALDYQRSVRGTGRDDAQSQGVGPRGIASFAGHQDSIEARSGRRPDGEPIIQVLHRKVRARHLSGPAIRICRRGIGTNVHCAGRFFAYMRVHTRLLNHRCDLALCSSSLCRLKKNSKEFDADGRVLRLKR